jgi:hypothetical protein
LANDIIDSGAPYWLFGEPDLAQRRRLRQLEAARVLEERAAVLRKQFQDETDDQAEIYAAIREHTN